MEMKTSVDFDDLASSGEFEEFFTIARDLTGLLIALVSPSGDRTKRLFPDERENPLCLLIKSCRKGREGCRQTDIQNYERAARGRIAVSYLCHAGMIDIAVPIYVDGRHIATMNCGQVLPVCPNQENWCEFHKRIRHLGLDESELMRAYFNSPFIEPSRLHIVLRMFGFFSDYFCEVGKRIKNLSPCSNSEVEIETAKRYIQAHYAESLYLHEIAAHIGFTPTYFSSLFRKTTGETLTLYVQRVRIEEAKFRLSSTSAKIADIAYEVGFSSHTHFNRVFSKLVGCSPSRYRRRGVDPHP